MQELEVKLNALNDRFDQAFDPTEYINSATRMYLVNQVATKRVDKRKARLSGAFLCTDVWLFVFEKLKELIKLWQDNDPGAAV